MMINSLRAKTRAPLWHRPAEEKVTLRIGSGEFLVSMTTTICGATLG